MQSMLQELKLSEEMKTSAETSVQKCTKDKFITLHTDFPTLGKLPPPTPSADDAIFTLEFK